MPPADPSWLRRAAAVAAIPVAIVAAAVLTLWADLGDDERTAVASVATAPRAVLAALFALAMIAAMAVLAWWWHSRLIVPVRRLAESLGIAAARPEHRAPVEGTADVAALAAAANAFAESHERLVGELEARVAAARADLEIERNRLAALMSELRSAVVVANDDALVLLYNPAARALLGGSDGAAIGLGRSLFGVFDRSLLVHALDEVHRQQARGELAPTSRFIATASGGALVRVTLAPASATGAASGERGAGLVLICEDVTAAIERGSRRDALLQSVTDATRSSLASIRAAVENLLNFPSASPERRERFLSVIADESVRLSARLEEAARQHVDSLSAEWPLEATRAEDLVVAARARIESRVGVPTKVDSLDAGAWIRADTYSLVQAATYLSARLVAEFGVREVRFRLAAGSRHAYVDVAWSGAPLSPETAFNWENDRFDVAGEPSSLTLKDVVARHGGEVWYHRDRPSQTAWFRIALPLISPPAASERTCETKHPSARPVFYDFDLFGLPASAGPLDERALDDLAYTVFDTETTGLDPSGGDEIVSIGAVRVVNGRLLHAETFETLVRSTRPIADESAAVHGIRSDMLTGQPPIDEVLPRFARFAADTVLVAHNAAFDMRFLAIQGSRIGVELDRPVLDTLLLSAAAHPNQPSHALDDIAARLGVSVVGRHTALGDALLAAEVFVRLLPLLAARGIRTLRDARLACEKTPYARLEY